MNADPLIQAARHAVTVEFLRRCAQAGYDRVAIEVADASVPDSVRFFGGVHVRCVFAWPRKNDASGWPAIWGIHDAMGFETSCGNRDQIQVAGDMPYLRGLYHRGETGRWRRVERSAGPAPHYTVVEELA